MARIDAFRRGDLSFSVRDSGPENGAPVVLLHGFPQNSSSWDQVATLLNRAGYRTLAPDQRGYCPDATPAGRHSYRIGELVEDVVELIGQAGLGPVHLVGHDWGAGVAWAVAATHPELLRSLTAVSVPHPTAFLLSMFSSSQIFQSYYMLMFQLPWLPELLMRKENGFFYQMLKRSGQTPAAALRDIRNLQEGDTATAAVNYYRALPYAVALAPALRHPITVPTLQVWSDGDTAVGRRGHDLTRKFVTGPWKLVVLEGVSHWIPEERPETLAELIEAHAASCAA
ncbi:MAG TPA: alpha/beta fold hydrolase [Mycobacterium sp.]|nr:alpha/beta fold hydrolase [Mycobacterium sp.]